MTASSTQSRPAAPERRERPSSWRPEAAAVADHHRRPPAGHVARAGTVACLQAHHGQRPRPQAAKDLEAMRPTPPRRTARAPRCQPARCERHEPVPRVSACTGQAADWAGVHPAGRATQVRGADIDRRGIGAEAAQRRSHAHRPRGRATPAPGPRLDDPGALEPGTNEPLRVCGIQALAGEQVGEVEPDRFRADARLAQARIGSVSTCRCRRPRSRPGQRQTVRGVGMPSA